jgi:hypothetical protein
MPSRLLVQYCKLLSKFQVSSCIQASKFDLLLVCARLVSKRRYSTRIRLRKVLSSNERRRKGCRCKAIRRRFVVKCRIGVNATDCTSSMPNALKSNAELNAELNARVRARGIKKCHSYGVKRNTTRIDRSEGKGDDLTANQQDCGDSVAINRPCVAHQICKGVGKAYN